MAEDRFTRAYLGIEPPCPCHRSHTAVAAAVREVVARAAPTAGFALRGCVLTLTDEQVDDRYVVVADGKTQAGSPMGATTCFERAGSLVA
jgi:hypothetical protein